ncbi:MAG: hypothetical protein QM658_01040 [Gordonia sp. (in: high G+C Gram-positive bacteria)]
MAAAVAALTIRFVHLMDDVEYYVARNGAGASSMATPSREQFSSIVVAAVIPRIRAVDQSITADRARRGLNAWLAIPDPYVQVPFDSLDDSLNAALLMAVTRDYHSWDAIAEEFSRRPVQREIASILSMLSSDSQRQ